MLSVLDARIEKLSWDESSLGGPEKHRTLHQADPSVVRSAVFD